VLSQELTHRDNDLFQMCLKSEVACGKKLNNCVGNVFLEGFGSRWYEVWVEFTPYREHWRLCGSKVLLELRVEFHVIGVVKEQVQLDINIAWPCQQCGVQGVALGCDQVGIHDSDRVLVA